MPDFASFSMPTKFTRGRERIKFLRVFLTAIRALRLLPTGQPVLACLSTYLRRDSGATQLVVERLADGRQGKLALHLRVLKEFIYLGFLFRCRQGTAKRLPQVVPLLHEIEGSAEMFEALAYVISVHRPDLNAWACLVASGRSLLPDEPHDQEAEPVAGYVVMPGVRGGFRFWGKLASGHMIATLGLFPPVGAAHTPYSAKGHPGVVVPRSSPSPTIAIANTIDDERAVS